MLVHGRLYATTSYLCFHAKIFTYETSLAVPWKDVASLTKEKTALVIPNAIQANTAGEKYFFTSFTARDKTYALLHKLWQNALTGEVGIVKFCFCTVASTTRNASSYTQQYKFCFRNGLPKTAFSFVLNC